MTFKTAQFDASVALQRLSEIRIPHPHIKQAVDRISLSMTTGADVEIILLVGPPGAGKSFAIEAVAGKIEQQYEVLKSALPNAKPVISVRTPEAGDKEFSFKMLYERIREAAKEPPLVGPRPQALPWEPNTSGRGPSIGWLRDAVRKCLEVRQARLLILDEAAHILSVRNSNRLYRHAMTLKSLANDSDAVLLLVCSYDGLPFLDVDSQLTRRIELVHLARYRDDVEEERKIFENALLTIGKRLELDEDELRLYTEPLIERCVGCVGSLVKTFRKAVVYQNEAAGPGFDYSLLHKAMPSKSFAGRLRAEVLEAEQRIQDY